MRRAIPGLGGGRTTRREAMAALAAAALLGTTRRAFADDDAVTVGMSTALTGPVRALGAGMKTGVEAYFGLVNAHGGVSGRLLKLEALDDAYEPNRTADNVRRL